jgi:hypothetical protein
MRCRQRAAVLNLSPTGSAGPPQEYNETFFCDSAACYGYHTNRTIWPLARQACKRAGGDLALMDAFDKQVALEAYFREQGVLNASFYWVGLSRVNSSSPFRWVSGSRVPTTPRRFPYAHWTWFQVCAVPPGPAVQLEVPFACSSSH